MRGIVRKMGQGFLPIVVVTVATFLVIGGIEGLARVLHWGKSDPDESVLFYQQITLPLFKEASLADGSKVYRASDARLGAQQFDLEKKAHTFRVFTFGGSATQGLGYSPNVTFSHFLQEFLQNMLPEAQVEVINCGVIGFSSKQVKTLLHHVREHYSPDLLVVYTGNNEFLELHAKMFVDRKLNASVLQMQDFLQRFASYRALRHAIQSIQKPRAPSEQDHSFAQFAFSESQIVEQLKMTRGEYQFVIRKYRENMEEVIRGAKDIPLLILTVASNLRWNDPDELESDWLEAFLQEKGMSYLEVQRSTRAFLLARAQALLEAELRSKVGHDPWEREKIDAQHYRLAKVYEEQKRFDKARHEFEMARDLDKRSRRALGAFNEIVLALGNEDRQHSNVHVIDTEAWLRNHLSHGIIGYEFFYDYVHFTPLGAQRVAQAIAEALRQKGPVPVRLQNFDYDAFVAAYGHDLASRKLDYPEAWRWIGFNFDRNEIVSINLFKYRDGVESLQRMLEVGREDPWLFTFLGNAAAHRLEDEREALRFYRKALEYVEPQDTALKIALLENMAWIYKRLGQSQQQEHLLKIARSVRESETSRERVALDKILNLH